MGTNQFEPRLIWTVGATIAQTNSRVVLVGPNPYQLNSYYTRALFHIRVTETSGIVILTRVFCYGAETLNAFPAPGAGFASQHVIWSTISNLAPGVGKLRQPAVVDGTLAPISKRRAGLVPAFILLEWSTSAIGDPGEVKFFEVWGSFLGPEVRGQQ
ncbi:MAG: hypothetical protein ACREB3_00035 [Burkholderiales bacterium]